MTGGSSGMGARSGVAQGGRLGHRHAARILQGCILVSGGIERNKVLSLEPYVGFP